MPYKDKVFSLSVGKCAVHGEDYGCGKNSITEEVSGQRWRIDVDFRASLSSG